MTALGILAAGNGCQGAAGGCLMKRCLGLDAGEVWRLEAVAAPVVPGEPCYMKSPSVC